MPGIQRRKVVGMDGFEPPSRRASICRSTAGATSRRFYSRANAAFFRCRWRRIPHTGNAHSYTSSQCRAGAGHEYQTRSACRGMPHTAQCTSLILQSCALRSKTTRDDLFFAIDLRDAAPAYPTSRSGTAHSRRTSQSGAALRGHTPPRGSPKYAPLPVPSALQADAITGSATSGLNISRRSWSLKPCVPPQRWQTIFVNRPIRNTSARPFVAIPGFHPQAGVWHGAVPRYSMTVKSPAAILVRPAGLQPATIALEVRCSVQLSYGRVFILVGTPWTRTTPRRPLCVTTVRTSSRLAYRLAAHPPAARPRSHSS